MVVNFISCYSEQFSTIIAATVQFISENGIVAVPGDENQIVRSDIWKINGPPSFDRGPMDQIRGN